MQTKRGYIASLLAVVQMYEGDYIITFHSNFQKAKSMANTLFY